MKAVLRQIGTGDEAIYATIRHMKRLARRDAKTPDIGVVADLIRSKAKQHKENASRYKLELTRQAFLWVVKKIKYVYDHEHVTEHFDVSDPTDTEFVIAPKHLLQIGKGDCDDMSVMLASLLLALDIEVMFKVIAHRSEAYTHVYVEALIEALDGSPVWIPLDPVMGADGWAFEKAPIIRKETFKV